MKLIAMSNTWHNTSQPPPPITNLVTCQTNDMQLFTMPTLVFNLKLNILQTRHTFTYLNRNICIRFQLNIDGMR